LGCRENNFSCKVKF